MAAWRSSVSCHARAVAREASCCRPNLPCGAPSAPVGVARQPSSRSRQPQQLQPAARAAAPAAAAHPWPLAPPPFRSPPAPLHSLLPAPPHQPTRPPARRLPLCRQVFAADRADRHRVGGRGVRVHHPHMHPRRHPLQRRQDPAAGPAGYHRGRLAGQGPRPAGGARRGAGALTPQRWAAAGRQLAEAMPSQPIPEQPRRPAAAGAAGARHTPAAHRPTRRAQSRRRRPPPARRSSLCASLQTCC